MYIQYVGFNTVAGSRIYNFHVIGPPRQAREFTVTIQSETFRSSPLKFQDGPGICFARLQQELKRETQGSLAEVHLSIGDREIREYLEQHYPRKSLAKKAASYGSRWS